MSEMFKNQKITDENMKSILEKNLKSIVLDVVKIKVGNNKKQIQNIKSGLGWYICECKQSIFAYNHYCPNCGRKIKRVE